MRKAKKRPLSSIGLFFKFLKKRAFGFSKLSFCVFIFFYTIIKRNGAKDGGNETFNYKYFLISYFSDVRII